MIKLDIRARYRVKNIAFHHAMSPLSLGSKKTIHAFYKIPVPYKVDNVFICWLVLTGAKNGSLSNALKSTSKSGVSSCCGVVKNSFCDFIGQRSCDCRFVQNIISKVCHRSMTPSSCSIGQRSKEKRESFAWWCLSRIAPLLKLKVRIVDGCRVFSKPHCCSTTSGTLYRVFRITAF